MMHETKQVIHPLSAHIKGVTLADFFDASPVATFAINRDHLVTHFNRACERLLGVNAADMIGKRTLGQVFYGFDRPVMADLIVDQTADESSEALYARHARRSELIADAFESEGFFPNIGDGGRWLYFTAAPLRDANGTIAGAVETLQDITERKRAQDALLTQQGELEERIAQRTRELSVARDHLVQSDKLASIGQLAAGVAHEINNPMGYIFSNFGTLEKYLVALFRMLSAYEQAETSIGDGQTLLHLQALREDIELDFLKEDIPALMRESKEGIVRVRKIVQDLKDFSHVDANPDWRLANLNDGMDSTLNVVNNEVKYKADVVKVYGDIPEIQCIPSEINQVVMNLVVNAAHAMGSERGRITVRTLAEGEHVCIEVADNGSGIPTDILPRIFDPFFTTKSVGKGTGLGLSLSYGIIQKHHGTINVQTQLGKGSTFRVTLPVRQPIIPAPATSGMPA
ncbi:MAG: ATP-binding protein [Comamonadaceae bacterium]|jgi:two-component system, NtrC family, sensor kinase